MAKQTKRIAIIGYGAIGSRVHNSLRKKICRDAHYAVLDRHVRERGLAEHDALSLFDNLEELLAWKPGLAVECAGHSAVATIVPRLTEQGTDVVLASIGALADPHLREQLLSGGQKGRLMLATGAIGGLDALESARAAGLTEVNYVGRKPPKAWAGTKAEQVVDLANITRPVVLFIGNAEHAAREYPKNANVTAAIAMAGIGFERTIVRLIADPAIKNNVHQLEANGAFGRLSVKIENEPLPDNPKTSWLAVLSIENAVRRYFDGSR